MIWGQKKGEGAARRVKTASKPPLDLRRKAQKAKKSYTRREKQRIIRAFVLILAQFDLLRHAWISS